MAFSFVAAGSIAGNATTTTQNIVAPSLSVNDLMIACLINKSATANTISAPAGWTQITQSTNDCTTAADDHEYAIFYKKAASGDSGATFQFSKATDDNVLFAGVIGAWRGQDLSNPLDTTAVGTTKTVGAADNVSFPAFDPTSTSVHVIFVAFYGNDLTTFDAAMSNDVNPDCTKRIDVESGTGNDCSIAATSGDNDGTNIAARTWASVSTTNAGNTGIVFAIKAPTTQTLSPSSFGSDEATPQPTITADTLQTVSPSATGSDEGFGTLQANLILFPNALSTNEGFGTHQLNLTIFADSIGSNEAFGSDQINLIMYPNSVGSDEAFGSNQISFIVYPSSIISDEAHGPTEISLAGGTQTVSPSSFGSDEGFGTDQINLVIFPSSTATSEGFGTDQVNLTIFPNTFGSDEAFGTDQLNLTIFPTSVGSNEAFGTNQINLTIYPNSLESNEAFGASFINFVISPGSIGSDEAFGADRLDLIIYPTSISSDEAVSAAILSLIILMNSIASHEAFGSLTITGGQQEGGGGSEEWMHYLIRYERIYGGGDTGGIPAQHGLSGGLRKR